jgi:hypothetical protein
MMRNFITFTLHQILLGLSNQGGWLGGACSTRGDMRSTYKMLFGKPEGKRTRVRPRCRWKDIRMDCMEIDGKVWTGFI